MKLRELINLDKYLKAIINNIELKIDVLLKFKLLGILKAIEVPIANFETIRIEKIQELGKRTENGNVIIEQDTEAYENFVATLTTLLDNEVEIIIPKLKASDVFDKGISVEYLMGLYPIIEE